MATTSETVVTSLKLASALHKRVEILASAHRQTPDTLIGEAVEQYVEHAEKQEQFRLDTLAASERFHTTRLHLTDEEVDRWITSLEAGEEASAPECHL
jgi:predicted transcriptional regulator